MSALSLWHAKPLRARLWMACGGVAAFMLTALIMNALFIPRDHAVTWRMLGHDFLAFYTAGTFVADGRADQLYDLSAVQDFQHQLARDNGIDTGGEFGPFWNPPFYAWLFAPLSRLSYSSALIVWTMMNLIALAGAIALLGRIVPRSTVLIAALILTSAPLILAISHGQNSCISLLLAAMVVSLWRKQSALLAGLCAGLLFFKPQLGVVIALILVIDLGWRALLGLSISGAAMLGLTLLTLPGALTQYLHRLPINIHQFQIAQPYMWERHVTLKAFWRLLVQGSAPGELSPLAASLALLCALLLVAALILAAIHCFPHRHPERTREGSGSCRAGQILRGVPLRMTEWFGRARDANSRDRLIAAAFCAMPLIMPFYFDYDLLLLAAPAALLARDAGQQRWLTRAWVALALWMYVNPAVASATGVNVTVILLACIAAVMLRRAIREKETSDEAEFLAVDRPVAVDRRRGAVAV